MFSLNSLVGYLQAFGLVQRVPGGGFVAWLLFYAIGMSITAYFLKEVKDAQPKEGLTKWTWKKLLYTLLLQNVQDYTSQIKGVVGYIPFVWGILIKHIIPPALIVVFVLGASAKTDDGKSVFGNYGGYVAMYQVLGVLAFCFAVIVIFVGAAAPSLYDWTVKPQIGMDEKLNEVIADSSSGEKSEDNNVVESQTNDEVSA